MQETRCPQCGGNKSTDTTNGNKKCLYCGTEFTPAMGYSNPYQSSDPFRAGVSGKSRGIAALLAIFLGALGIQYFYIGKSSAGVICLCITIFTCGIAASVLSVLALIQGIMMLIMSEAEFEQKYIYTPSSFPMF